MGIINPMEKDTQLITQLQNLTKDNKELNNTLNDFIQLYSDTKKQNEKITKENIFFLKKWDKRNLLDIDEDTKKLVQKSKLDTTKEIVQTVQEQCYQPLQNINLVIDELVEDFKNNEIDDEYIQILKQKIQTQTLQISEIFDEFKHFLGPLKSDEIFCIEEIMNNVQNLMQEKLNKENITLKLDISKGIEFFGNSDEFEYIFINLINNSIEAFETQNIQNKTISLRCYKENENIYIEFQDNAGGVDNSMLEYIFKPNTTTKPDAKGIGMYIASQIINKNDGCINVHNNETGALFTIIFRKNLQRLK